MDVVPTGNIQCPVSKRNCRVVKLQLCGGTRCTGQTRAFPSLHHHHCSGFIHNLLLCLQLGNREETSEGRRARDATAGRGLPAAPFSCPTFCASPSLAVSRNATAFMAHGMRGIPRRRRHCLFTKLFISHVQNVCATNEEYWILQPGIKAQTRR